MAISIAIVLVSSLHFVVVGVAAVQCELLISVENSTTGTCIGIPSGEQQRLSCPNISSAFNYISANVSSSSVNYCVHVTLSPGYHMFTQPHNLSVGLILTGNGATVQCDYESIIRPVYNASDLLYTLFFWQVSLVKFEMVRFKKCKQPFRFEKVENVTLLNSYFTQFADAVFDIHNCIHINIDNSTFINNTGHGTVLLPLRGNTGAVSISYYNNDNFGNDAVPTVLITDCHFINNSAIVSEETFSTSTVAFLRNTFTGRGGGIAFLMNLTVGDLNVNIRRCVFQQNKAVSFGGAAYLQFAGKELHHMMRIEDSLFAENFVERSGAGAIQVTFNRAEVVSGQPMTALMHNCSFISNKAVLGGAVFLFPSIEGTEGNLMVLQNCYFHGNQAFETGAAVIASQFAFFVPKDKLVNHRITNCTFVENRSPNGIVAVSYATLEFTGINNFSNNTGRAVQIIGSLVDIHDTTVFEQNTVTGVNGALYLRSFGQLRVFPQTSLLFDRNSGRIGSSIVALSQTNRAVYNRLIHNPQCFLLYADQDTPLLHLSKDVVNFTFSHNQADMGSAMLFFTAQSCSWIGNEPPYFDTTSIPTWNFIDVIGDEENTSIRTAATKLVLPDEVTGWPGQRLPVSIQVADEFNFSTFVLVALMPHNSSNVRGNVLISHSAQFTTTSKEDIIQLDYSIDRKNVISDKNEPISIRVQQLYTSLNSDILLHIIPCIAGYKLVNRSTQYSCQCNLDIGHILHCENDQVTILLYEGLWAWSDLGDPDNNLRAYRCPPGYCGCSRTTSLGSDECLSVYNNSDPNLQCSCNREGTLCGHCKDGKGVSVLFNRCVDCSNGFVALIVALIIADVTIMTVILLKQITLPAWLFPAIFNIQMISYVGEYYPVTYETTGKYIYYIGSAISLYFPYDFCLYSGMTTLTSYAFRYIPFWLSLIIFTAIFCYYYRKRQHRAKTYGLWTLILLLYSHTAYASMNVLNCPSVSDLNGVYKLRWYFNGTIECFNDTGHIILGSWAILVLIFCFLLVPFVSKGVLQKPYWLVHFIRVHRHPYKVKWWFTIELARRLILVLSITAFPGNTCPATLILMIMFSVYAYCMPYKDLLANITELVFQLVFLLFLLLRSTSNIVDSYNKFSGHVNSDSCSDSEYDVTDLTLLLLPFAWLPVIGTILLILSHLVNLKLCLQHLKEWLKSRREADDLQTWFEQPNEPHYKTVFMEFTPSDTTDSWRFVVLENEDHI